MPSPTALKLYHIKELSLKSNFLDTWFPEAMDEMRQSYIGDLVLFDQISIICPEMLYIAFTTTQHLKILRNWPYNGYFDIDVEVAVIRKE